MQHFCYMFGYCLFLNVAPTGDFSVFPEYDSIVRVCQNVLYVDTVQFVV
jgi:hypothetical protein